MISRREAIALLGSISAGHLLPTASLQEEAPLLAPGAPSSPERVALITAFRQKSDGIDRAFEARSLKRDWEMPYRLFRPPPAGASGKLPLVVYLHGSGGLGTDNQKQMGLGNIFGTRVWALPENQARFPCYVVAPQTDRGWVRYGPPDAADSLSRVIAGLGDGARLVLELIEALRREFPIDERRLYITGQSMGGSGVWHLIAQRPRLFAAAVPCCGAETLDDITRAVAVPIWNFHGDADPSVPVSLSRERIAALRKAGGHPIYTEYPGVRHESWQWAYTEPALAEWVFSKRRQG